MIPRLGMGVACGLASALLFSLLAKATPLSVALVYLSPTPLLIAALGWGLDMGLLGALVASAATAAAFETGPTAGLVFAGAVAFPALALSAAILWGSKGPRTGGRLQPRDLVLCTAGVGVAFGLAQLAEFVLKAGGVAAAEREYAEALAPLLKLWSANIGVGEDVQLEPYAQALARLAPAAVAFVAGAVAAVNAYVGAKAVWMSGRLPRLWQKLPDALRLPRPLVGVLVAAIAGSFLPSPISSVAIVLATACGLAFAIEGLAVLHVLTRGWAVRIPALFAVYLSLLLGLIVTTPVLALIGIVDSLVSLRRDGGTQTSGGFGRPPNS